MMIKIEARVCVREKFEIRSFHSIDYGLCRFVELAGAVHNQTGCCLDRVPGTIEVPRLPRLSTSLN